MKWHFILAIVLEIGFGPTVASASIIDRSSGRHGRHLQGSGLRGSLHSLRTNEADYDDLVKPCLNDLVANLIHHKDADGHILYEARESFELTPRRFSALVAKAKKAIIEEEDVEEKAEAGLDQRRSGVSGSQPLGLPPKSPTSSSGSWPWFNGVGNFLFGRFTIPEDRLHMSPIDARRSELLQERGRAELEESMQEENGKLFFCPGLTKTILNQIFRDGSNGDSGSQSGLLSGSLNINKADTELQKKRSKIVARNVEKSLMILFLKDYGWLQLADVSLNPFKTVRSLGSGMRMIYDANMEALLGESLCAEWFQISC